MFLTVNKHKPWIETTYHGIVTENDDKVLLDPPLIALDKDAPLRYAGERGGLMLLLLFIFSQLHFTWNDSFTTEKGRILTVLYHQSFENVLHIMDAEKLFINELYKFHFRLTVDFFIN